MTKSECYEYFSSFEINTNIGLNLINKFYNDIPIPFDNQYKWYAIVELSSYDNVNLEKKISNIISKSKLGLVRAVSKFLRLNKA